MRTAMTSENIDQPTQFPAKIRVTSLKPSVDFSESCDPVSLNADGCALHSAKQIAVGTPVLLQLQTGTEATGQVAFCKPSSSSDKLWGLGVVLDKPEPSRVNAFPKDHAAGDEDGDVLLSDNCVGVDIGMLPQSAGIPDVTTATVDSLSVELRKEMDAIVKEGRVKLEEELQTQRRNFAGTEAISQDAIDVRSLSALHQLQEELGRQITDGVDNALQQIEVRLDTLMVRAEAELEKGQHLLREVTDKYFEEKRQEITGATLSMGQISDQIYSAVQHDFQGKQKIVESSQNAIATEVERLQAEVANVDDRVAKLHELSAQFEDQFCGRLDQMVMETITQARTSIEQLLEEIRNNQLGLARAEVQSVLAMVSTRTNSLIEDELRSFAEILVHERDETQIQVAAVRQEKQEMQLWLVQKDKDFRKVIEDVLFDARVLGRTSVQKALDMIRDPLDKLSCQAKNKIEEVAARQCAQLDEGIRHLRDELVMLQEQAGNSLRASIEVVSETPNGCYKLAPDKLKPDAAI